MINVMAFWRDTATLLSIPRAKRGEWGIEKGHVFCLAPACVCTCIFSPMGVWEIGRGVCVCVSVVSPDLCRFWTDRDEIWNVGAPRPCRGYSPSGILNFWLFCFWIFFRNFDPPFALYVPRGVKIRKNSGQEKCWPWGSFPTKFSPFPKFLTFLMQHFFGNFWLSVYYSSYPRESKFEKTQNTKNVRHIGVTQRDFHRFPEYWLM